jgi:hypothetical protein
MKKQFLLTNVVWQICVKASTNVQAEYGQYLNIGWYGFKPTKKQVEEFEKKFLKRVYRLGKRELGQNP